MALMAWVKRITAFALPVLVLIPTAIFGFSEMAVQPTPSQVAQLAANERPLTLTSSDNVRIEAAFYPSQDPDADVILLLHGNGASRMQFASHVEWLNAAGYSAMVLDFRGHGASQAENKSFGYLEGRDAVAAVEWIRANHPKAKIGVIGVSLGGAAALLGEGKPIAVDAMVLKAVYPDFDRAIRNRMAVHMGNWIAPVVTPLLTQQARWRYDTSPDAISPVLAARQFTGSVLVIGGVEDVYTPEAESRELGEAFPGRHWIWMVPGMGHAQMADLDDPAYRERVATFFNEELRR